MRRSGGRCTSCRKSPAETPHAARLGYVADATANNDKPGGKGKRPTR